MFVDALGIVEKFTLPIIVSKRTFNGNVSSGLATFIILNEEGWVMTAAHVLSELGVIDLHKKELDDYHNKVKQIESDTSLIQQKKVKRIAHLRTNPEWITNISFWWGKDGVSIPNYHYDLQIDLVIGKIENFDKNSIPNYPIFKNPNSEFKPGSSLCKLGFPFHNIQTTFNIQNGSFTLDPNAFPVPRFPLDGIFTREAVFVDQATRRESSFIEMSSPGLRGQSGGPIFDRDGIIWGLQSQTITLPLGFSPKLIRNGREIEENQFINLGLGTNVKEIIKFLDQHKVKYNLSA